MPWTALRGTRAHALIVAGTVALFGAPAWASGFPAPDKWRTERPNRLAQSLAVTLSQTASSSVVSGNSSSCNSGGFHLDNSYYRRFRLSDHGISTDFTVSEVGVGIELAASTAGDQSISVRLYAIPTASSMSLASLTLINQVSVNVSNQSLTILPVAVSGLLTAPATRDLVVEVFTPNGVALANSLLIGSNAGGETRPGYIRAPDCGITDVAELAAVGLASMRVVLTVTGTTGTTSVHGVWPLAFALGGVRPNPAVAGRFTVHFTLPTEAPTMLELVDVLGRRVARRDLGSLGTGPHEVECDAISRLAPGVYTVRLTHQGRSLAAQLMVTE